MGHPPLKVLVTGHRDWTDQDGLWSVLDEYRERHVVLLVHGAARGTDSMAGAWAKARDVPVWVYPAKWTEHHPDFCPGEWCVNRKRSYCVGAGARRNTEMLQDFQPDITIAFKESFNFSLSSGGTEHCVRIALHAGVPVVVITDPHHPGGRTEYPAQQRLC